MVNLGIENYWGFLLAGILLNITPGADTMYILTRSVAEGRKAGIYSVLGISTGGLIHTLFASLGLSVILSTSATAFMIVKYAGAAYLVYLGIKHLIEKPNLFAGTNTGDVPQGLSKIYRQGIFTNVLNPKVALFFLSFLPQFINPEFSNGILPFLILGGTFIITGTIWCLFLAFAASQLTQTLRKHQKIAKWFQKISGMVFITLGIHLAVNRS